MSRLDDIKDQLKSAVSQTWERIQESSTYHNLKDRYDNLSPLGQKIAIFGSVTVLLLLLFLTPWSHYRTASENISNYEDKQKTIRELLRVSRDSGEGPDLFPAPPMEAMKSQIESGLKSVGIIPIQIKSLAIGVAQGSMIPRDLTTGVLEVTLAKLNLKQIVEVGYKLSTLATAAKLKDMDLTPNLEDSRYFDAHFSVYTLKVPEKRAEAPPEPEEKSKKPKASKDKVDE